MNKTHVRYSAAFLAAMLTLGTAVASDAGFAGAAPSCAAEGVALEQDAAKLLVSKFVAAKFVAARQPSTQAQASGCTSRFIGRSASSASGGAPRRASSDR